MDILSETIDNLSDEAILMGNKIRKVLLKEFPFWPKEARDRFIDRIFDVSGTFEDLSNEAFEVDSILEE